MSDEEITTNNPMDVDTAPNDSPSSSAPVTSNVILDIGIGSGDISDSDDDDINEPIPSKSSTPDSTTLPTTITKKPLTTHKPPFTKNKSSLVSYEADSGDEEHTDEDEEEDNNEEQDGEDDHSNSNSAVILHAPEENDLLQIETTTVIEQTIVTSDLLNVTPLKPEETSPSHRTDLTPNYPLIFPEDADIRIPPEPAKSCSTKLQEKFEEYYKRFKKTGVDQNVRIQELKDFRNPCMYEKMISHLGIDEIGTNFPQELYDPHWWGKESYYEELSKAQKLEMDRREKERRERTKISFTPGVKKVDQLGVGSSMNPDMGGEKRKTRFDQ
ncbi:unnamed protein product [Rotaria sordida]|uniref:SAP30-binding protein n=1 Tax=Rotaria sordida TaxID=392033 RepID=A0A814PQY5_9BILA|nr:unnamed protein product [Rotaria sordida]CAF1037978.1 unnamed protein product [Rotaria sordida]CAF1109330.1 unnamed protein product [Rotaria sordida]CAF3786750.1 unnamed protein product [Rotaria sordida]CAF3799931.1 unnamed protein product [Rotaria sordida]